MLANGITLSYGKAKGSYTKLAGLKEVPEFGIEPEKVENWEYQKSESETLPMTTYTFQNNRFEFILYDDKVQRISIYADSYNDFTAPGFSFNEKDDILRALGIDPATVPESSRIDTGQALRYESIGKIRYIWVPSYEGNSYDEIKISFSDLL